MAKKPWKDVTLEEKIQMKMMVERVSPDTPVSPEHAASYLNKSPATLQKMRCEDSEGIPFVKIGKRAVGYIKRDLQAYVQARQYRSTSEYV